MEIFPVLKVSLPDSWTGDRALREALHFHLGAEIFEGAEADLAAMGQTATLTETLALVATAERQPPEHVPYSAWGERIDDIRVSDAYYELGRIGVEAGVTALPYEDSSFDDKARLVWAGLVLLWGPSSALYSCPVAMTDAAARTMILHGGPDEEEPIRRLTTRDFDEAWSSGQWMTEVTGGSDVAQTGTAARKDADGRWRLHGTKWFTSATTSEMALTLARPEGAPQGSRGLDLFRIHRVLPDGTRNSIRVRRLKDKLGTRALPTAELELEGAIAHPVGGHIDGGGVRRIATMLNITRIHNSIGAAGALGRGLAWARAYAAERQVFGKPLHTMPAHRATLTDLAVDHAAALALTLRACELLGRSEKGTATDADEAVLRGLTPVAKLATARWAVAGTAEAMEAIGGVAYCEDSSIPALVRNTHVLPIWEGTTNVLSLDLLRATARSGALEALLADARAAVESIGEDPLVSEAATTVKRALGELSDRATTLLEDPDAAQASARSLAIGVASTYACARLCAQGSWAARELGDRRTAAMAVRLAERGLVPPTAPRDLGLSMDEEL